MKQKEILAVMLVTLMLADEGNYLTISFKIIEYWEFLNKI